MERVRRIHPYPCECGNVSVQRQTFSLRTLTVAVHLENIVSTNLLCVGFLLGAEAAIRDDT